MGSAAIRACIAPIAAEAAPAEQLGPVTGVNVL
jgi:hypothetical protein